MSPKILTVTEEKKQLGGGVRLQTSQLTRGSKDGVILGTVPSLHDLFILFLTLHGFRNLALPYLH